MSIIFKKYKQANIATMMQCPCGSNHSYSACCEVLHQGKASAQNVAQLMRSRYCAYVLQEIDYIVQTTVPSQQNLLDRQAILTWSKQTKWDGLEVITHQEKLGKTHAKVEFKAYFLTSNATSVSVRDAHHERSAFVKIAERWYFIDPTVAMPTMKQPCLCGSQKKFRQCCYPYLMR